MVPVPVDAHVSAGELQDVLEIVKRVALVNAAAPAGLAPPGWRYICHIVDRIARQAQRDRRLLVADDLVNAAVALRLAAEWRTEVLGVDHFATEREWIAHLFERLADEVGEACPPMCPRPPGRKIRSARAAAGLTQVELAEKLRVDEKTVRRWEQGVNPHLRHRQALVRVLGGRPSDYMEEDE